jgi:prohibitin 1
MQTEGKTTNKNFKTGGIIVGAIILLSAVITPLFITTIEAGHAGVVYNRNGGLEDQTLGQGWHVVSPFKRITEYPIATETVEYKDVKVGTSDGKPIVTTFSYNYHIDLEHLPNIFNKFRGQKADIIEEAFLRQRLTEVAKNVTTKYSVLEVLGEKSQEISLAIQKSFSDDVKDTGFIIESVTFQPPAPDENTAKAIQAKVDAQQKLEQEKVELEKSKVIADRQRIEAQGVADKARIEAEGVSKANELLRQSMTKELVEYEWIKKWDGKVPTVNGDGAGVIMNMPSIGQTR